MRHFALSLLFAAGLAGAALAQAPAEGEGEIRKIDRDASKVTIKHGPIAAIDMPPMTMVFRVKDPALFDKIREGQSVRFSVVKEGGAMVITSAEPK